MAAVIGVPKEVKDNEQRVSMQPDGVTELVHHGQEVVVEAGAGIGAGFEDEEYESSGARLVGTSDEVFEAAGLIVKVKEPVRRSMTYSGGAELFTYCTSPLTGTSRSSSWSGR